MSDAPLAAPTLQLRGEVVYFYAFDIAYELRRPALKTLLGRPLEAQQIGLSKKSPRQQLFYQPRTANLESIVLRGADGRELSVRRAVKVIPIGAISITLRVPFAVH
ncbi:MAG: hypothetical protein ACAI34_13460, partial [Verrucomicrobium sp.]